MGAKGGTKERLDGRFLGSTMLQATDSGGADSEFSGTDVPVSSSS